MSAHDIERLRRIVCDRADAQTALAMIEDEERCIAALVELARAEALDVTADEIRGVMAATRRRWLERWI